MTFSIVPFGRHLEFTFTEHGLQLVTHFHGGFYHILACGLGYSAGSLVRSLGTDVMRCWGATGLRQLQRGQRGARSSPAVKKKKKQGKSTGEWHTSASQVLISASALETTEVSYFWKACSLFASLSSNAASYGRRMSAGPFSRFIERLATMTSEKKKRWYGGKGAHSILRQNMLEIHLTSWQSLRWRWLFALPYRKVLVLTLKFVSAFYRALHHQGQRKK